MATPAKRRPENVPGDFYVDSSCINCDACRIFAPGVFRENNLQSSVYHQPETEAELLAAQKAMISCPTASIGCMRPAAAREAINALPEPLDDDVERCGYTSSESFGGFSYFIRGAQILVDSPRFAEPLAKRLGNVRLMLLTHSDDLADHDRYRARFSCERVMHAADAGELVFERMPTGRDPLDLGDGVVMIPTPGHTPGHAVYLYRDKFLFSGDHLYWSPMRGHLAAYHKRCWYSWPEQIASMERLLDYSFEWVLPGHGRPAHLPAAEMRASLERCIAWMKDQ